MGKLKPIHKQYLAIGNNREIYNSVSDSSNLEYFIDFGLPIEWYIYSFLKDIYQLALIGVFNFTAYYKCLSIKNLGLRAWLRRTLWVALTTARGTHQLI